MAIITEILHGFLPNRYCVWYFSGVKSGISFICGFSIFWFSYLVYVEYFLTFIVSGARSEEKNRSSDILVWRRRLTLPSNLSYCDVWFFKRCQSFMFVDRRLDMSNNNSEWFLGLELECVLSALKSILYSY